MVDDTKAARKSRRYRITAPVIWHGTDDSMRMSHGITRDLGMHGIFVLSDDIPDQGSRIELDAFLPMTGNCNKVFRLHAAGLVLRVEQDTSEKGFAAEVLFEDEPAETLLGPTLVQ